MKGSRRGDESRDYCGLFLYITLFALLFVASFFCATFVLSFKQLALYLELGDPAAIKPSLPHEYNLAEYLNEPPPRHSAPRLPSLPPLEVARATAHDDARGGGGGATSVDAANDDGLMTSPKLTEAMVVHFAQVNHI
jgi:hypothetical protein